MAFCWQGCSPAPPQLLLGPVGFSRLGKAVLPPGCPPRAFHTWKTQHENFIWGVRGRICHPSPILPRTQFKWYQKMNIFFKANIEKVLSGGKSFPHLNKSDCLCHTPGKSDNIHFWFFPHPLSHLFSAHVSSNFVLLSSMLLLLNTWPSKFIFHRRCLGWISCITNRFLWCLREPQSFWVKTGEAGWVCWVYHLYSWKADHKTGAKGFLLV